MFFRTVSQNCLMDQIKICNIDVISQTDIAIAKANLTTNKTIILNLSFFFISGHLVSNLEGLGYIKETLNFHE